MNNEPKTAEFRVQIGRADRGETFVRVIHTPTKKDRIVVGLGAAEPDEVAARLMQELSNEIAGSRSDSDQTA
jgi:hypothetical protein